MWPRCTTPRSSGCPTRHDRGGLTAGGWTVVTAAATVAFIHHLAAFTLVAALAVEAVLVSGAMTVRSTRVVQRADMILGAAAGVLLIAGLARSSISRRAGRT